MRSSGGPQGDYSMKTTCWISNSNREVRRTKRGGYQPNRRRLFVEKLEGRMLLSGAPMITLGGSQGTEAESQSQSFSWSVVEEDGISALSVVIRRNGQAVYSTTDPAQAVGSRSFDDLGLGTYTIEVSATGAGGPDYSLID